MQQTITMQTSIYNNIYSDTELNHFKNNTQDLYGINTEFFSDLFLSQLKYYYDNRIYDISHIIKSIKLYESGNYCRKTEFSGSILNNFHHIHFFNAQFIQKNILNDILSPESNKDIQLICDSINNDTLDIESNTNKFLWNTTNKFLNNINNATGEWIIFKKYKNNNYYLTLALHELNNNEILELCNNAISSYNKNTTNKLC